MSEGRHGSKYLTAKCDIARRSVDPVDAARIVTEEEGVVIVIEGGRSFDASACFDTPLLVASFDI